MAEDVRKKVEEEKKKVEEEKMEIVALVEATLENREKRRIEERKERMRKISVYNKNTYTNGMHQTKLP